MCAVWMVRMCGRFLRVPGAGTVKPKSTHSQKHAHTQSARRHGSNKYLLRFPADAAANRLRKVICVCVWVCVCVKIGSCSCLSFCANRRPHSPDERWRRTSLVQRCEYVIRVVWPPEICGARPVRSEIGIICARTTASYIYIYIFVPRPVELVVEHSDHVAEWPSQMEMPRRQRNVRSDVCKTAATTTKTWTTTLSSIRRLHNIISIMGNGRFRSINAPDSHGRKHLSRPTHRSTGASSDQRRRIGLASVCVWVFLFGVVDVSVNCERHANGQNKSVISYHTYHHHTYGHHFRNCFRPTNVGTNGGMDLLANCGDVCALGV